MLPNRLYLFTLLFKKTIIKDYHITNKQRATQQLTKSTSVVSDKHHANY